MRPSILRGLEFMAGQTAHLKPASQLRGLVLLLTLAAATTSMPAAGQPVHVGYLQSSPDPNRVGVGGNWDFDSGVAGTDSMQFWRGVYADWHFDLARLPNLLDRWTWYFPYGNETTVGNSNLWIARGLSGRQYRRQGVIGVWHRDPMTGLPGVSGALAGSYSAWCGLRAPGDNLVRDESTNNAFTGELAFQWGGAPGAHTSWPGYGDQWDQMLYHDIVVPSGGTDLSFRLRTNLSQQVEPSDGWYTPNSDFVGHIVAQPADSFTVWIGQPKSSSVFDVNRRDLSDALRFDAPGSSQPQKLYAVSGQVDGTVNLVIPYLGWSATRVVFQVKTNRRASDESGYDTADGAAVVDDVVFTNPSQAWDFETTGQIRPARVISATGAQTTIDPLTAWISTGRPTGGSSHVESRNSIFLYFFDFACEGCPLVGNVLAPGNHDGLSHGPEVETWSAAISPTIRFDPGNPQGTHDAVVQAGKTSVRLTGDLFLGKTHPEYSGVMCKVGVRYSSAAQPQTQGAPVAAWSTVSFPHGDGIYDTRDWQCVPLDVDLTDLLPPLAEVDSIQVVVSATTRCVRYGSVGCGDSDGPFFDNLRLEFVEPPSASTRRREVAQKGGR